MMAVDPEEVKQDSTCTVFGHRSITAIREKAPGNY